MKRHLNTLFVTTQDTWLSKEGECVELRHDGKTLGKIPMHTLQSIVCFGHIACSQYLLEHCAELGLTVSWFTEYGRFMASMQGPTKGNVLLRRAQYRSADSLEDSAKLARFFVMGKVSNCRTVILRQARNSDEQGLEEAAKKLGRILKSLILQQDINTVRGMEGDAAHIYFAVFPLLIKKEFRQNMLFSGRTRKPPRDEVNCLLSFFYSLLANDVRSALEGVGLDPAVGFLHRERPGRPSLALDMMEEFRPYLADRLALTLINRQQIGSSDFIRTEVGGFILKDKARKEVLTAWQERKREEVEHPFLKEKMTVGMMCHIQARLLARYLRGDLDAYPPFAMR
ncbi:MAG: type I-C CRISPR-associated endonuclease Cas1 [Desulfovibrio sp.]|nr:type I-C CRISPR-associated endonuclease Cas1 [Desulfovibrio sp.]